MNIRKKSVLAPVILSSILITVIFLNKSDKYTEEQRCSIPEFAKKMGNEVEWLKYNSCSPKNPLPKLTAQLG